MGSQAAIQQSTCSPAVMELALSYVASPWTAKKPPEITEHLGGYSWWLMGCAGFGRSLRYKCSPISVQLRTIRDSISVQNLFCGSNSFSLIGH